MSENLELIESTDTLVTKDAARKKRVILEIGTSENPFPVTTQKEIGKDELFIGFDWGKREAFLAGQKLCRLDTRSEIPRLFELQADGRKIPMKDNSVNEVVLVNVFSLLHNLKSKHGINHQDTVLREIKRVLKNGGLLTVVETLTPVSAQSGLTDIEKLGLVEILSPILREREIIRYARFSQKKHHSDSFIAQYKKENN